MTLKYQCISLKRPIQFFGQEDPCYPTLPDPTLYPIHYTTLPHPTLPYPTLPYPNLPYPTLTYPTLSLLQAYPTLPNPDPRGSVVEHPLRDREVVGSNSSRAIPKALKWYQWLPCLVLSIIRQALASLLTNIAQLTLQHSQKIKKSDNNQCLYSPEDRMEDWQSC